MEIILAPYLFGALVGFISFYFIRKYKEYSSKNLGLTLGIVAGNSILPSVMAYIGDNEFVYRYLIGVPIGVFFYLVYLVIIKRLKEKGRIFDFEGYASCGISSDDFDNMEAFDCLSRRINTLLGDWKNQKLTDEQIISKINEIPMKKIIYDGCVKYNYFDKKAYQDLVSKNLDKQIVFNAE